jgi:CheY-like chemotaxis protein
LLLKTVLEENGYTCIEAADGQEAVDRFKRHRGDIDLVILDMVMPRKNGAVASQEIQEIRNDVRILFISGYTADLILQKGLMENAATIISKPLTPFDLLRNVQEILRGCPPSP